MQGKTKGRRKIIGLLAKVFVLIIALSSVVYGGFYWEYPYIINRGIFPFANGRYLIYATTKASQKSVILTDIISPQNKIVIYKTATPEYYPNYNLTRFANNILCVYNDDKNYINLAIIDKKSLEILKRRTIIKGNSINSYPSVKILNGRPVIFYHRILPQREVNISAIFMDSNFNIKNKLNITGFRSSYFPVAIYIKRPYIIFQGRRSKDKMPFIYIADISNPNKKLNAFKIYTDSGTLPSVGIINNQLYIAFETKSNKNKIVLIKQASPNTFNVIARFEGENYSRAKLYNNMLFFLERAYNSKIWVYDIKSGSKEIFFSKKGTIYSYDITKVGEELIAIVYTRKGIYIYYPDKSVNKPIVSSTTHKSGIPSNIMPAIFNIQRPKDSSGILGYAYIINQEPDTIPSIINLDNGKERHEIIYRTFEDGKYFLHIIAVDNAGNKSDVVHYPFEVDITPPQITNIAIISNILILKTNKDISGYYIKGFNNGKVLFTLKTNGNIKLPDYSYSYTINISAFDLAGNVSEPTNIAISYVPLTTTTTTTTTITNITTTTTISTTITQSYNPAVKIITYKIISLYIYLAKTYKNYINYTIKLLKKIINTPLKAKTQLNKAITVKIGCSICNLLMIGALALFTFIMIGILIRFYQKKKLKKVRFSLYIKYIITVAISFVFVIMFLGYNFTILTLETSNKILFNQDINRMKSIVYNIADIVRDGLVEGDDIVVIDGINQAKRFEEINFLLLLNAKKQVLFSLKANINEKEFKNIKRLLAHQTDKTEISIHPKPDISNIKSYYYFVKNIYYKGVNLGWVAIKYNTGKIKGIASLIKENIFSFAIYIIILSFIISSIIALLLAYITVKPINSIVNGVQRFSQGDFNYRVKTKRRDELGFLANEFNDMATKILAYQEELVKQERIKEQLEIARQIQSDMLGQASYQRGSLNVACYHKYLMSVGGDYYDIIDAGKGKTAILICDVSGKGIPAALIMVMIRTIVRTYGSSIEKPSDLVSIINDLLVDAIATGNFATMMLIMYNHKTKTAYFTNAGHGKLNIYRAKKKIVEQIESYDSPPTGIIKGSKFTNERVKLNNGDIIFLSTDGLFEISINGKEIDEKLINEFIIKNAKISASEIIKRFEKLIKRGIGEKQRDDITFLVAKIGKNEK